MKDDDGNIVKSFRYNYGLGAAPAPSAQSLFYNVAVQEDYTKQGCPAGTYGDVVTYSIPYGKHVSSISQADADLKASDDKTANGQANANNKGLCRWYNAGRTAKIFKNNCPPELGVGMYILYPVPFGAFRSVISPQDAEDMAQADVLTRGQEIANETGRCSCEGEGLKMINGQCETGEPLITGSDWQLDGQWKCTYIYRFSDGTNAGPYYRYQTIQCPENP